MDVRRLRGRVRNSAQTTRRVSMYGGEIYRNPHVVKDEDSSTKKQLIPKLSKAVEYFKEYCKLSGIHGVRYLAEDRRYFIEKLFWFVALTMCATGCSLMIIKVKEKLDKTPVIVTFAESPTNIWHLPFPAVTICPLTTIRRNVFNYTKYANMAKDGEDMYDSYKAWVETMFSKVAKKMYDENLNDSLSDKSSFVEGVVKDEIRPYLYGDRISDEITTLLSQLYTLIKSEKDVINFKHNSTWMEMKFAEFHNGSESLREIMDVYYKIWRNEIYLKLRALYYICSASSDYWDSTFGYNDTISDVLDEDALRYLVKVAPQLDSNGRENENKFLVWEHTEALIPLKEKFRQIWTDNGICFTFNMMDHDQVYSDQIITNEMFPYEPSGIKDWHPNQGYSTKAGRKTYPRRPLGVRRNAGLHLALIESSEDVDYLCRGGVASGYKVILHRPEDHPQQLLHFAVDALFLKEVWITVSPFLTTTSPGLKNYDAHKRQCYYSHENHLEYFKFYSQNNCELECLTKATLKACGCVAFYMPRNSSTKVCGMNLWDCIVDAAARREEQEIDEDLEKLTEKDAGNFGSASTKTECDCLPSCVTIFYNAEVSMIDVNLKKFLEVNKGASFYDYRTEDNYLNIHVLYKSKHVLGNRRSELYGEIDFLANCGGLLGLFSGFSIVSLIELTYFLTLRLWSNFYRSWTSNRIQFISRSDRP